MKQEILVRMGLALCALFIFGKFLAPALGRWFWETVFGPKKRENRQVDFDRLVESKKAMLRKGEGPSGIPQGNLSTRKSSPTVERYREAFVELSRKASRSEREEGELSRLKSLLSLFDSLQWGGGGEIEGIAQKLSKKLGVRIESAQVVMTIKTTLKNHWAVGRKSSQLPSLGELISLWECYLFWQFLVKELAEGEKGKLSALLKSRFSVSIKDLKKAVIATTAKMEGRSVSPKQVLGGQVNLISQEKLESCALQFLLSEDKKFFRSKREWSQVLEEEVLVYSSLSPLPPLKNDRDVQGAYRALGLTEGVSIEKVKKRYKKLALLKHPDKLSSKGIPSEFESIATENFALIQRAYTILKKNLAS